MKKILAASASAVLLALPGIALAGGYYDTYGGYGYGNQGYYGYPAQQVYYSWGNPSMSVPEYGCNGVYQYTPCQPIVYQQPQRQQYYQQPTYNYPQYNYPQQQYYPQTQQYNPYLYNTNTNNNTNNNVNNIVISNNSNAYMYIPGYGYYPW